MKGAAATGAALSMPAVAWAANARPCVFVADRTLALPAAVAATISARGGTVIDPREHDLGIAWRKQIPVLLTRYGGRVEGIAEWSDWLVCEIFAREHGLILVRPPLALSATRDADLHAWAFSSLHAISNP